MSRGSDCSGAITAQTILCEPLGLTPSSGKAEQSTMSMELMLNTRSLLCQPSRTATSDLTGPMVSGNTNHFHNRVRARAQSASETDPVRPTFPIASLSLAASVLLVVWFSWSSKGEFRESWFKIF